MEQFFTDNFLFFWTTSVCKSLSAKINSQKSISGNINNEQQIDRFLISMMLNKIIKFSEEGFQAAFSTPRISPRLHLLSQNTLNHTPTMQVPLLITKLRTNNPQPDTDSQQRNDQSLYQGMIDSSSKSYNEVDTSTYLVPAIDTLIDPTDHKL